MQRKMFLFALIALFAATLLTGCNNSSSACYAGILIVNDQEYLLSGDDDNKFTAGEKIGEVQTKVNADVFPKGNFSSNILEVGEEIFSSNEDNEVLIVKREDEGYFKLSRRNKGD
ncbi:hypothetical protein [Paenibacillus dakarensis]|uniref:hypothetical protein n=1 Tax=Paenibacillus dakarensis TaxID=1527293 RepID=UPI0006D5B664|nr:hypothetical protein [Paenibacillus dakarensis]